MGSSSGYRRRPRRGSLQFWPRKRANRMYPRVRQWRSSNQAKILGFAGYKAGMTHIIFVDSRANSPTKGEEVRIPVTILETPALRILGIRLYSKSVYGYKILGEAWSDQLTTELSRRLKLPKKRQEADSLKKLEAMLEKATACRVIAYTQPKLTGFGKKKPDVIELDVGGANVQEQFEFAKSVLGNEIKSADVFKEGEFLDIHAVTKGKGFQGPVKRFGISILHRKSHTDGRRKPGTLGNWQAKTWRVPRAGQMGFHTRTEYNKQLIKLANISEEDVNPKSGIVNYGIVKGDYALISGSVAGPKKRLIRLTPGSRAFRKNTQPIEVTHISLEAQQ